MRMMMVIKLQRQALDGLAGPWPRGLHKILPFPQGQPRLGQSRLIFALGVYDGDDGRPMELQRGK